LGVALLAAWRSKGDIPTMSLTLGLPLGVLAFWGIYSFRMKRTALELGFVRDHPRVREHPPGSGRRGCFKPKLLHRGCHTRLTTDSGRPLPRFRTRTRADALSWDTQDTPAVRDQWHM
jgi:hypothetical protein